MQREALFRPFGMGKPARDSRKLYWVIRKVGHTQATLFAWGFTPAACIGLILAAIRFSLPFLAVTNRMHGDVLVLEGWLPVCALGQAAALTTTGDYLEFQK